MSKKKKKKNIRSSCPRAVCCEQKTTRLKKAGVLVARVLAPRFMRIARKLFSWSDPYVSAEEVNEALMDWKNRSNQLFYQLMFQCGKSSLIETLCEKIALENGDCVMRPVLPTVEEISGRVDAIAFRYESRIRECMTRPQLDVLIMSLNRDRGKYRMEVVERVEKFQSLRILRDACLVFLGEMHGFRKEVLEIMAFDDVNHNADSEEGLLRLLKEISEAWVHFEKGSEVKNIAELYAFHAAVDVWYQEVYRLCDNICGVGNADLGSFIAGYRARKFPETTMVDKKT